MIEPRHGSNLLKLISNLFSIIIHQIREKMTYVKLKKYSLQWQFLPLLMWLSSHLMQYDFHFHQRKASSLALIQRLLNLTFQLRKLVRSSDHPLNSKKHAIKDLFPTCGSIHEGRIATIFGTSTIFSTVVSILSIWLCSFVNSFKGQFCQPKPRRVKVCLKLSLFYIKLGNSTINLNFWRTINPNGQFRPIMWTRETFKWAFMPEGLRLTKLLLAPLTKVTEILNCL